MTQPTDIVERLELFEVSDALGDGDFSVCIEAAAEITRLRAELADAHTRGVKAGLEAALKALKTAQYDPAPYTKGSSAIRAIDPATVAIDPETGHA